MSDKEEKKILNGGHISKKVKAIIYGALASITLLIIYLVVGSSNKGNINAEHAGSSQEAKEAILGIMQNNDVLLFRDYIVLDGKQYQIKMVNGRLMVFRDGNWMPLSEVNHRKTEGAIISKDGKLYRYVNGRLVPLKAGTILRKDGLSYRIGADGKLHQVDTEGVIWRNGVPHVNERGRLRPVREGETVMINGKPMTWRDGHFVPADDNVIWRDGVPYVMEDGVLRAVKEGETVLVNDEPMTWRDGHFVPAEKDEVIWKDGQPYIKENGELRALREGESALVNGKRMIWKNGHFVPMDDDVVWKNGQPYVDENGKLRAVKEGEVVRIKGKAMIWKNGEFVPVAEGVVWKDGVPYVKGENGELRQVKEGETVLIGGQPMVWRNGEFVTADPKSALVGETPPGYPEPVSGDYGVTMGKNGEPIYWQFKNGKLVPVTKDQLKENDLVYFKGKPYRVGKDGKLKELIAGNPVNRNGKVYTVDQFGHLKEVKEGEVIDVNGQPYMLKDGKLVKMSAEDAAALVANKQIAWINGKPYLMGEDGKPRAILEGEIIFRAGQAYRYVNGRFIKVNPDELKQPEPKDQPEQKKQNDQPQSQSEPTQTKNNYLVGDDEELRAAVSSGFDVKVDKYGNHPSSSKNNNLAGVGGGSNVDTENLLDKLANQPDAYAQANGQSEKMQFMQDAAKRGLPTSNTSYQRVKSMFTIYMGTMLNATLVTGINSDLPGQIVAQINSNIYDSSTGNYLLIPQGTKVLGVYDSKISYGQERVLMAWTTLVFPNGDRIDLEGQPGVDLQGYAGMSGSVDNHWWPVFGNVLMMSIFASGIQYAAGAANTSATGTDAMQLVAASIGQQLGQAGLEIIQKSMNIQPTINIEPGDNFKILLTKDFILPSPYEGYNAPALILK